MRYYNLVLALIPLALVSVTGALITADVALMTAVSVAATVSAGIVGHALFVNPPVPAAA